MLEDLGTPSAARRILSALARFGVDLRPALRRARAAIVRPVRHELATETAALRGQLEARLAAETTGLRGQFNAQIAAETTGLRAHFDAQTTALRAQVDAQIATETTALRAQMDAHIAAETAALRAQFDARSAAMTARLDEEATKRQALESQLTEIAGRLAAATDDRQAIQVQLSELSSQVRAEAHARGHLQADLAQAAARLAAEQTDRRTRLAVLEALITDSNPPRSPEAARRLHEIASPIVSVILPTRNRARFVGDAIASVQAQHFTDWELIIVDDGSTDDTAAAMAPYLGDKRIRYLPGQAHGVSAARNRGLEHARGAFIAYLDSDNIWYPGFLAAAVGTLASEPAVNLVYGVLVTDSHQLDGTRLLWEAFDHERLMCANYIDMNVIVHRKSLIERYGVFDESLARLNDWDLVLRYTEHDPARPLPELAARYRVCDELRITTTRPFGPELFTIKRKWHSRSGAHYRPRILYVLWQYPQLSETYIEAEIRCMVRLGAHVEVWREMQQAATPHPTSVPIHDGPLADGVRRVRPDVIHVHWLGFATKRAASLAELGIPVTVRLHGFDTSREACRAILEHPWIRAVYAFPHHLDLVGRNDPRLRAIPAAFDTALFRPSAGKNRRLVVRTGSALPSKDPTLFFEVANRLPNHRFVLAAVTCTSRNAMPRHIGICIGR